MEAKDNNKFNASVWTWLDKSRLKTVTVATIAFMLAAYMYAFMNGSFLFDATFIYRGPEPFRVASDKWAAGLLGILDMHVNQPWLAGLLAIGFMIVSVYYITDILEVKRKWGICLIAGLCATQSSIICQQEYTGGNYTGEIALAFSCIAVWVLVKTQMRMVARTVLAAVLIALSAGIYGAYVSVVPGLLILTLGQDIVFKEKAAKETWKRAFLYLGQFIAGMVLYYVILRLGMHFTGSQLQSYMGEDNLSSVSGIWNMVKNVRKAYVYVIQYYLGWHEYLPDMLEKIQLLGMAVGVVLSGIVFFRRRKAIRDFWPNMALLVSLLLLFPMALNLIYIMSAGNVHYLMIFTYVLPFLFFVKEMEFCVGDGALKDRIGFYVGILYRAIICVFLYYSVVMANAVFVQYHNMYIVAQSIGTRILDRIETCEGFEGTENVVFIGAIQYNAYWGETNEERAEILDAYQGPVSAYNVNALNWASICRRFLNNILGSKLEYREYNSLESYAAEEDPDPALLRELQTMEAFPRSGSVKKIGNKIYVVFSDDEMNRQAEQ